MCFTTDHGRGHRLDALQRDLHAGLSVPDGLTLAPSALNAKEGAALQWAWGDEDLACKFQQRCSLPGSLTLEWVLKLGA